MSPKSSASWQILVVAVLMTFTPAAGSAAPLEQPLQTFSAAIATATPAESLSDFAVLLPSLRAAEATTPGLALGDLAGEMSANCLAAVLHEALALADLQTAAQTTDPKGASLAVLPRIMAPMFDLARNGPDSSTGLYALGLAIDVAAGEGLTSIDLLGANPDPSELTTYGKAKAAQEANADAAALQKASLQNIEDFLDRVSGMIPPDLAPGLTSPAGVFFEDLVNWDEDMWSSSTDALTLVSNAIKTGKLDMAAYDKIAKHLEALGRQGPWTQQSGLEFLKRVTGGVPVVGKFLPALWEALAGTNGKPTIQAAVPTVTAPSGQLPPQSFSLGLGGGATATVTASPGYEVHSGGNVTVGLVKISSDGLPAFLHADAPPESGEEAHRWVLYPEQQIVAIGVDYDNGSADVPINVGAFEAQAAAPKGATRITGFNITFAPSGTSIVLRWPANIPIK